MAMSSGNSDFVALSNGSVATRAPTPSVLSACDGDLAAPQLTPKEATRTKVSPNGCLQLNGTVKSSFLPSDSQRTPPMLSQCCHPCPYHHPLTSHGSHQECHPEAGPAAPSALAPCCMQPHSEYSASLCPHHSPVYQTACCLQPSPSFCLHPPWPDHFQHQPVPQHMASVRPPRPFKLPKSYAALIADWPVVVLGMCTVLIVVCALVGVLVPELPDFSDPLLGFEPRGTAIGQRLVTWNNMVKNTGYKATLANYPFKYADEQAKSHRDDRWSEDHYEREKREVDWNFHKDGFFCDVPSDRYSRVVFTSAGGETLWNLPAIKSMCNVDNSRIRSHPQFGDLCQRTTAASCCPSWTLGNYIAILNNRSSCQKIVERDVSHTLKLLRACAKHYQNGTLGPDCWDMAARRKDQLKCTHVPRKCTKFNAVYQILHYLVDKDFLAPKTAGLAAPALKYSMLFSPTEKGQSMMSIYLDNFENWNSSDGVTTVTGIEFGIKHSLFQDYLLMDTVYPAIAIVIVLLVMCVYTKSMFITLMTMFAIISSLIVSYFLYRVVFNFEFFPFMNLTALIILVGIGADDAFVLCDVWTYTKCDKPHAATSEAVSVTLRHAALSMFVTSFTTAAAFYANYVSSITAIRCFGVYAGTAILVNYVLMVTWLPAAVVLHERYLLNIFSCFRKPRQQRYRPESRWRAAWQRCRSALLAVSEASRIFFEKVLPCLVIKFRYLWLFWFLALTAGGAYVVCVNPRMKLPSLELAEFQVFRASHPFERYDAEYKKLFMFERVHHGEDLHMPITVVWGVSPEDNGNPLNPKSKGKLALDGSFNIASPASQAWILHFCQKLRNQTFFYQTDEQDFTSCFIETFKQWMENQDCDEPALYPCCSHWSFPYKQEVFELCIKRAIMELERSTGYHLDSKTPGPRFDINDTIRAVVLEFQSTYLFTLAYEKMHQFYKEVDSWISRELRSAPEGLSNGWFVSNLEFYDLQDSLSDGTLVAMGLSVAVAFSVMLLTTWNVVISLYAIVSIAGTIFVTVGSLVLLGWELNVLESVTISVAVGLSVDFAVHYGVAYRLAPDADREGKVVFSLSRMGSAIAMAALTTFVAGAMMMPSTVLAYTQLGTFMMLSMCVSWAFATFFFQCVCRCLGPQGTCGQIPLPKKLQCGAFSHALPASAGDKGQSKAHAMNAYHPDPRGQPAELEHEFYELEPLAAHGCTGPERTAYEETRVCPECFSGPARTRGLPVRAALGGELGTSGKRDAGVALGQPSLEQRGVCPLFSLRPRCSCPPAYRHLKFGPHCCQQLGGCLCPPCAPAAGSFAPIQNGLAPLKATHRAAEGFLPPAPHVHACACLQGTAEPPGTRGSLPRNLFLPPGQHVQAQEKLGQTGAQGLPGGEGRPPRGAGQPPRGAGQTPKGAEPPSLVCTSTGPLHKACCDPENKPRGLCKNRDVGTPESSGGTEDKASGSASQSDAAGGRGEPRLPQPDARSERFPQREPQPLLNRFLAEAGGGPCPDGPQSCGRAASLKCNSVDCQTPHVDTALPAVFTHSELSGESLLIKTL
ncbi:protein dispatched homolog 1 isoform X1 [Lemur catta]|uniref:protein dispatched homolog 1 isoform X1 n=1 Tax=Lemur catta TaxID=9447 RepID=UPI001E26A96D|nr:protein dispatched homolog 1 isoform X1 [Lemur catta]XP_045393023.1 protein dispatched homolog 1 isoform X1 [Lemur catta]XP_045393024.1 protein dispatched homolog 1 isoform X1 [Lemur catta]XP_045393025.1 protein dispatched homolog 1 isoform X1 [Lemur catta]XP_045393026.1 protein dispatched homolog 1 isoform X1 [Lemur catta]XP_045393027.1 protein dispatched homolog 1 isoform X1 [Lemur catta]XP_045393028.1 protein dispatched homolog 1 isoform X1 [Lemur catta]XP_045393029.1 protein dispatche